MWLILSGDLHQNMKRHLVLAFCHYITEAIRRKWYWICPNCHDAFRPELDNMVGYQDIDDPVTASEAAKIALPSLSASS